ncbi:MAG: DUF6603 domain-containing protein [Cytophagales bacterium]|nr:DUF6603 domain-containing protein [Cytophagales bacterium]
MFTQFFSQKVLALSGSDGRLGITATQGTNGSIWCCQVLPKDIAGGLLSLIEWLAGDSVVNQLRSTGEAGEELERLIKLEGAKLQLLGGLASMEIEQFRLAIEKLSASELGTTGSVFTLSFKGELDVSDWVGLRGELVLQVKPGMPASVQFQLSEASQLPPVTIPIPGYPSLILASTVSALDVVREEVNGTKTSALISAGLIGIVGGPESLTQYFPEELVFNLVIASMTDISGTSNLQVSMTIPHLMEDVTVPIPEIPEIVTIPSLPKLDFGSVNMLLSNLSVVLESKAGFQPYLTVDCGLGLPAELNKFTGTDADGKANLDWIQTFDPNRPDETRITGRLSIKPEGIEYQLLTPPIKGIDTQSKSNVPGAQQGNTWIIDLEEEGLIHLDPPVFARSNTSQAMAASGGFHIIRPLKIALAPFHQLIDDVLFSGANSVLPDHLELKDIALLKDGKLSSEDLGQLWGDTLTDGLQVLFDQLSGLVSYLPNQLKSYLNFTIPDRFHYNLRLNADGSAMGGVLLSEEQPLRLLLPAGLGLLGVELRQASLGQLNGGKLGLLELDVTVHYFFLPEIVASMTLSKARTPLIPHASTLHTQVELRKVMAIINFQTGAVMPMFYDKIALGRLGAEGFNLASQFSLPKPTSDILNMVSLVATMVDFLTLPADKPKGLLDPKVIPEALETCFEIGLQYLKTPEYTGEQLLGKETSLLNVASADLWPHVAHTFNFLKTGQIDEFVQSFPLEYRVGEQDLSFFGLIDLGLSWVVSSPEEFKTTSFSKLNPKQSGVAPTLALLPNDQDNNRLVALLHGEVTLSKAARLSGTLAFSGGFAGASTGFCFNGTLVNQLIGVTLTGKVALETDPALLAIEGASELTLLGFPVLSGQVGLKNDELFLSGALDLFPNSKILSLAADVAGQFTSQSIDITGSTIFKVRGVPLITGAVKLTDHSLQVSGTMLGIDAQIGLAKQGNDVKISGGCSMQQEFSLSTGPIIIQGVKVSDPVGFDTSISASLSVSASLNQFTFAVDTKFAALGEEFSQELRLSVMPSSSEGLWEQLKSGAVELVEDFLTDLLNRPEKLLEVLARTALKATKVDVTAISIDGAKGDDVGLLSLQSRLFNISTIATYNGGNSLDRLFAYAQMKNPTINLSSFQVKRMALALAANRKVRMPKAKKVERFPLVKQLGESMTISDQPTSNAIREAKKAISSLVKELPKKEGIQTLAVGFKGTSFGLIHSTNVFMVEMGSDLAAYLVGMASIKLPPKPLTTVVNMEVKYKGAVDVASGSIKIDGKLTDNSYVLSKAAKLTGDFAAYSWLAGKLAGDFVVTMGGYAPKFNKPSHYPSLSRLKLNWKITSKLKAKGKMYMALTPTNVMAGGKLEATYKAGPLKASFDAGLHFMMYWQPFYYEADLSVNISAAVTLKIKIEVWGVGFTIKKTFKASLGADLEVWGPSFAGKAKVDWTIFSFDIKFGSQSKPNAKSISWRKFREDYLSDGKHLTPDFAVVRGGLGVMTDPDGEVWQIIDPDQIELRCNSKFPLRKLSLLPAASDQQDEAWSVEGEPFHLAPTDPNGEESTDEWYLDVKYNGPDGMYFHGETLERPYPKAVWGKDFKPKPSKHPTMTLLSGTRFVPKPGKPPGFTEAVDADEFKFQDVVENDPTWQWGTMLKRSFEKEETKNEQLIRETITTDRVMKRRQALADFIEYQEPMSMKDSARCPAAVFVGMPSTTTN